MLAGCSACARVHIFLPASRRPGTSRVGSDTALGTGRPRVAKDSTASLNHSTICTIFAPLRSASTAKKQRKRCGRPSHTETFAQQPEKAMGQESPIEPCLAAENRAACGSPNGLASSRRNDENRWQRKPKALLARSNVPRSRNGRLQQSCPNGLDWKARKNSAAEEVYFP